MVVAVIVCSVVDVPNPGEPVAPGEPVIVTDLVARKTWRRLDGEGLDEFRSRIRREGGPAILEGR